MLTQKIIDPYKIVKSRKKRSSNGRIFQKKIDIQNRRGIVGFFRKKTLDTSKPVNRRKNIEKTQFNK